MEQEYRGFIVRDNWRDQLTEEQKASRFATVMTHDDDGGELKIVRGFIVSKQMTREADKECPPGFCILGLRADR